MPGSPGQKRRYSSAVRTTRATATRRRVLEAARKVFTAHGYTGATVSAIAREGKVSPETVYAVFGTKRALLAELVRVSVLGDSRPIPLLERQGPRAVRGSRSQGEQVRMFASQMGDIMERVGPLFRLMHVAAATEPEIAALLGQFLQQRLQGMRAFLDMVTANGPLRPGLDPRGAAETVWAMSSAEVHWLLTVNRGWSGTRYRRWLADSLEAVLLAAPPTPPPAGAP